MIGLDAAEARADRALDRRRRLPISPGCAPAAAIAGCASSAAWLAGSPWPTFYNRGNSPATHVASIHFLQWRCRRSGRSRGRRHGHWLPLAASPARASGRAGRARWWSIDAEQLLTPPAAVRSRSDSWDRPTTHLRPRRPPTRRYAIAKDQGGLWHLAGRPGGARPAGAADAARAGRGSSATRCAASPR